MCFAVGVWGGFFGAGFGILARYLLIFCFGRSMLETAGISQLICAGVFVVAIPIFAYNGVFAWNSAIPLLVGMVVGGWIGASYAVLKGDRFLKKLFFAVVILSSLKLLLFP